MLVLSMTVMVCLGALWERRQLCSALPLCLAANLEGCLEVKPGSFKIVPTYSLVVALYFYYSSVK